MTDDTKELRAQFEQRSSEELVSILRDHDEGEWRPEVFDIVASVLESRGVSAVASPPSPNPTADGSAPVVVSTTPQPRLWFEIIAVLCIAVLPDVSHAVYWSLFAPTEQSSLVYSYAAIGLRGLFVSVPVLYVISLSRMPERFGLVRVSVGDLVLATAIFTLNLALYRLVSPFLGGYRSGMRAVPDGVGQWVLLVAATSLNAFAEELVTRGYLIARLETVLASGTAALVLSSALFASYHVYLGLSGAVFTLCIGLLFGTAFLMTRRLWPVVIAHFLWNIHATVVAAF